MQHKYFESGEIIIESGELAKNLFIINKKKFKHLHLKKDILDPSSPKP